MENSKLWSWDITYQIGLIGIKEKYSNKDSYIQHEQQLSSLQ